MTKSELLQAMAIKVDQANPIIKEVFLRGLKYRTNKELKDLLQKIEISEDGYDISTL